MVEWHGIPTPKKGKQNFGEFNRERYRTNQKTTNFYAETKRQALLQMAGTKPSI
ncbi:MAG: hypothetical protein AAF316_15470 [Cyanobacteria bacterium P01_A01_bin.80]